MYWHWPTDISAQQPWLPGFDVAQHPHTRATSKYILSKIKITNSDTCPPPTPDPTGETVTATSNNYPLLLKETQSFQKQIIYFL